MNLFLIGADASGGLRPEVARAAVEELLGALPFLPDRPVERWGGERVCAAWCAHAPSDVGGVAYTATTPGRLALFAGRPIRWSRDRRRVDGRGPLDAAGYLAPPATWTDGLDGRAVVARLDAEASGAEPAVTLWTDPLGAYPLFTAREGSQRWWSNAPDVLRRLVGDDALDLGALAGLVGAGWPLDGQPVWARVRRVGRGVLLSVGADGAEAERAQLPLGELARLYGGAPDPADAARRLVAVSGALADWPGRPSIVPITGGRDSRVVLAAAAAAGFPHRVTTAGGDHEADVIIGRQVAEAAGAPWAPFGVPEGGARGTHPLATLRLTALVGGGTVSAGDGSGFPLAPQPGPLVLWHTGQGGEIARGYYGRARRPTRAGLVAQLEAAVTSRRPGRPGLLSHDGRVVLRAALRSWVDAVRDAGVRPADVPDAFYLLRRMGTWAGPTFGPPEWVRDSTAPLWTAGLLGDLLAGSPRARAQELYALRTLEQLAPALVGLPFEGGRPWPSQTSTLARRTARARTLAAKAEGVLRARYAARRATAPAAEPFDAAALPHAAPPRQVNPPSPVAPPPTEAASPADPPVRGADEASARADPRSRSGLTRPGDPPAAISAPQAFALTHAWVRERALDDREHPVWELLHRPRTERLLTVAPGALDGHGELLVWRLATVWALRELER